MFYNVELTFKYASTCNKKVFNKILTKERTKMVLSYHMLLLGKQIDK